MDIKESINKSIGAHGLWKRRILQAIESGESEWSPDLVYLDDQCEFGKWLYNLQDKTSPHYNTVLGLHREFHKVASRVLTLALKGKKKEAQAAIAEGSEYYEISKSLTRTMMEWMREV